jgi:hypothetical protein
MNMSAFCWSQSSLGGAVAAKRKSPRIAARAFDL